MTEQLVLRYADSASERFAAADRRDQRRLVRAALLAAGRRRACHALPADLAGRRVVQDQRRDLREPWLLAEEPDFDGYIEGWKTSTAYTFATLLLEHVPDHRAQGRRARRSPARWSPTASPASSSRARRSCSPSLIATLLLPNVVTRIPQYLLFRDIGWLDTFLPLWVPSAFAGDAFFVFMLVQFLRAIPRDMEEAARVDGANTWQTLIYIVVPLLTPALISVCLFQFMWTMNDFLGPLIYISSVDKYPVSLALKLSIDATEAFEWNRILAMSVLALMPSLVVFFIAQKYFIEGISDRRCQGLVMAQLQIRNLEKVYANGFKAVHGIDLDVADGEFMVLVGPSGCAKSTTLRMIAGLETITGGEIRIGDRVVNDLTPGKRGISMVFQNYALYPHMKVRNNLSFGLQAQAPPQGRDRPSAPPRSPRRSRSARCSTACPSSSPAARRSASRSAAR